MAARTLFAPIRSIGFLLTDFMTLTLLFSKRDASGSFVNLLPLESLGNLPGRREKAFGNLPEGEKNGAFGSSAVMAFSGFRPVALRHRLSATLPFRAYFFSKVRGSY
jgi:hypothetical protein